MLEERSVYYIFSNGHKISTHIGYRNELDVSGNLFYYTCTIHVYKVPIVWNDALLRWNFVKRASFFPTIYHFIGLRNGHKKRPFERFFFLFVRPLTWQFIIYDEYKSSIVSFNIMWNSNNSITYRLCITTDTSAVPRSEGSVQETDNKRVFKDFYWDLRC